jgi:hypothetical protein
LKNLINCGVFRVLQAIRPEAEAAEKRSLLISLINSGVFQTLATS